MSSFETRLTGGHPNSLGNTVEVVEEVLAEPARFADLFACYFSEDDVVRLRVSNAMKRIGKANKALLLPYVDRFLTEIAAIDQASAQWTLAQLFLLLEKDLTPEQITAATELIKRNLTTSDDWIVLNESMRTLGTWAKRDPDLRTWLMPQLNRLQQDTRKSVSNRATKMLAALG